MRARLAAFSATIVILILLAAAPAGARTAPVSWKHAKSFSGDGRVTLSVPGKQTAAEQRIVDGDLYLLTTARFARSSKPLNHQYYQHVNARGKANRGPFPVRLDVNGRDVLAASIAADGSLYYVFAKKDKLFAAHVETNGRADRTFGPGGLVQLPLPFSRDVSIRKLANGNVGIAGAVSARSTKIAMFKSDGTALLSGDGSFGTIAELRGATLRSSTGGAIYVAGWTPSTESHAPDQRFAPTSLALNQAATLVRLTGTGTLDTGFANSGRVSIETLGVNAWAGTALDSSPQPDGSANITTYFRSGTYGGTRIVHYYSDGRRDQCFSAVQTCITYGAGLDIPANTFFDYHGEVAGTTLTDSPNGGYQQWYWSTASTQKPGTYREITGVKINAAGLVLANSEIFFDHKDPMDITALLSAPKRQYLLLVGTLGRTVRVSKLVP
ncbi:MAG: hypothetical protein ACRDKI_06145 [Solirubrobacterales bacterium]